MNTQQTSTGIGVTFGLVAMACWGTVPLFMKYLTTSMGDAWTMNLCRYGVAGIIYLPVLIYFIARKRLTWKMYLASLVPTAANTIGQILWAQSAFHFDAGVISIFIRTSLIWSTACSLIIFSDERPLLKKPLFWTGLMLTFGALIGLAAVQLHNRTAAVTGLTLILTCAFFWGLYPVTVKITLTDTDPRCAFSMICVNTAVLLIIFGSIWGNPGVIKTLSLQTIGVIIASAIFGISISHMSYYYALKHVGVIVATNLNLIGPFYTLAFSAMIFGEHVTWEKVIFGLLIITGAAFITITKSRITGQEARLVA